MQRLAPHPVRRWVRGHQVFAVLTQGLIWSFHRLNQAVEDQDSDATVRALDRLTLMFDASAAGFRFASNFDPLHYTDTIRPSMCEPHVPKGFSGTLSSDHGRLVSLMVGMRPLLAQVQAEFLRALRRDDRSPQRPLRGPQACVRALRRREPRPACAAKGAQGHTPAWKCSTASRPSA